LNSVIDLVTQIMPDHDELDDLRRDQQQHEQQQLGQQQDADLNAALAMGENSFPRSPNTTLTLTCSLHLLMKCRCRAYTTRAGEQQQRQHPASHPCQGHP
jgi:DNA repair protein RadC